MFVKDDPTQKTKCRWYFASPTAIPFPVPHAFGSPTWDTEHPTPTSLGWDATSSRTYFNGKRSNTTRGQSFAGPLAYFQGGADDPSDLERGVNGTPVECLKRPFGIALSGSATLQYSVNTTCCPKGIPWRFLGTIVQSSGPEPWTFNSPVAFTYDSSADCWRGMTNGRDYLGNPYTLWFAVACRVALAPNTWSMGQSTTGPVVVPPFIWLANFANIVCKPFGGVSFVFNGPPIAGNLSHFVWSEM